jgi:AraC-like DNA-binding protein
VNKIPLITSIALQEARSKGKSIPELSQMFNISKSTVLRYVKNTEIKPEYIREWRLRRKGSLHRKIKFEKIAKTKAISTIKNIDTKDSLLIFASLYWAEGNKKDFCLTNSDPKMISLFVKILISILEINPSRIRASIRIYEDMNESMCRIFWEEILSNDIKISKVTILKGKKEGKLVYGMCRIRVIKAHELLKYTVAIRDRISELI